MSGCKLRRATVTASAVLAAWGTCASAALGQATLINLGTLAGGDESSAYGVSSDGSVVVGADWAATGGRAFRWTSAGGMVDLGTPPGGVVALAHGVSGDGSAVVGFSGQSTSGAGHAFRWTGAGGMEDLGTLGTGTYSTAAGVSGDGSAVVGYSGAPFAGWRAFRWTSAGGMQDLGTLPGGGDSSATGVSGDGAVVVGAGIDPSGYWRAFRWTGAGGMQNLGTIPGGSHSYAYGVTGEGSTIVGWADHVASGDIRAFRWTSAGGMQDLGTLPGGDGFAEARGVSGDGSAVVGIGFSGFAPRAFLWTPSLGMADLNDYLPTLGVNLTGWSLEFASGTSADGSSIVGYGTFEGAYRGWLVTGLPPGGTSFTSLCDPGVVGVIACPCSNPPAGPGRGCDNSSTTGGAILAAAGGTYLSSDSLVFTTSGERPTALSIVLQGDAELASGVIYGQGVRCVGGSLKRLFVKAAVAGSITAPNFGAGDPTVSARSAALGDVIQPGQSRWYLVYYRDPIVLGGCPATSTFNATQTGQVTWSP